MPILGQHIANDLNAPVKKEHENQGTGLDVSLNHHPAILNLLAEELSVKPEDINDFELYCTHFDLPNAFNNHSGIYMTCNLHA